jgi:hypothetical protein
MRRGGGRRRPSVPLGFIHHRIIRRCVSIAYPRHAAYASSGPTPPRRAPPPFSRPTHLAGAALLLPRRRHHLRRAPPHPAQNAPPPTGKPPILPAHRKTAAGALAAAVDHCLPENPQPPSGDPAVAMPRRAGVFQPPPLLRTRPGSAAQPAAMTTPIAHFPAPDCLLSVIHASSSLAHSDISYCLKLLAGRGFGLAELLCFGPYGREVGTQREPVCERWKLWEAERMTILRWCFATFDTKDICDAAVV